MKRIFALVLVALMLIVAACNTQSTQEFVTGEVVDRDFVSIRAEDRVFPDDSTLFKVLDRRGETHFFVIPKTQTWALDDFKGNTVRVNVQYNNNDVVAKRYEAISNLDGTKTIKEVSWFKVKEVRVFYKISPPKTIVVSR